MEMVTFFLIVLLLMASYVLAATGTVTISLSRSMVLWNDSVTVSGNANYTDTTPISSANVNITVGTVTCNNVTDSNGAYSCIFNAPQELGAHTLRVNVTKSGESFINTTTLNVKLDFGEKASGTVDRSVYETPVLIQEMSGKVRRVFARLMIWRS